MERWINIILPDDDDDDDDDDNGDDDDDDGDDDDVYFKYVRVVVTVVTLSIENWFNWVISGINMSELVGLKWSS